MGKQSGRRYAGRRRCSLGAEAIKSFCNRKDHKISIPAVCNAVLQRVKRRPDGGPGEQQAYEQRHEVKKRYVQIDISMRGY